MIPKQTWKYGEMTLRSGYFWKCFAFYTRKKKNSYEVIKRKNYTLVKFVNALAVLSHACTISYIGAGYAVLNVPDATSILAAGFIVMLILFIGIQIWHIRSMENITRILRQFIHVDSYLRNQSF